MSFALVGSVLCALILLPVLCTWFLRGKIREPRNLVFDYVRRSYGATLRLCLRHRVISTVFMLLIFAHRCC